MLNVRLAVSTVAPPGATRVIVSVAVEVRSARIDQETACVAPGETAGRVWVALCGLSSLIESVGVKLTRTVYPLAGDPPVFATEPVAVKNWPRRIVVGTPPSVRSSTGGDPLFTVTEIAADVA